MLRGAVDAFVMPSLCEGLGMAAVEAQAAGVPSFTGRYHSRARPMSVPPLVKRLSLSQPVHVWSRALLAARSRPRPVSPSEALAALERSPFNICKSVAELQQLYTSAIAASISR